MCFPEFLKNKRFLCNYIKYIFKFFVYQSWITKDIHKFMLITMYLSFMKQQDALFQLKMQKKQSPGLKKCDRHWHD